MTSSPDLIPAAELKKLDVVLSAPDVAASYFPATVTGVYSDGFVALDPRGESLLYPVGPEAEVRVER